MDSNPVKLVIIWDPQRISYRISAMVSRCVLGCAPSYLRDLCRPVADVAARRVLRSATKGMLLVPRARLAIGQRRPFSVVGPSIWNELPLELRSLLAVRPAGFYKSLKSFFFSRGWLEALLSTFLKGRYINSQNE